MLLLYGFPSDSVGVLTIIYYKALNKIVSCRTSWTSLSPSSFTDTCHTGLLAVSYVYQELLPLELLPLEQLELFLLFPLCEMLIPCILAWLIFSFPLGLYLKVTFPGYLIQKFYFLPPYSSSMLYFSLAIVLLSLAIKGKLHEGSKFCLFYLLICSYCLEYAWPIISTQ